MLRYLQNKPMPLQFIHREQVFLLMAEITVEYPQRSKIPYLHSKSAFVFLKLTASKSLVRNAICNNCGI